MIEWLNIINPEVKLRVGNLKYAVIDFDGTISVIRQGWEDVMIPMMIEMICNGNPPISKIEEEVREYVDYSTGILTIKQMQWLTEAIRRHGITKQVKNSYHYKRIYNERLLRRIEKRREKLRSGDLKTKDLVIKGAQDFLHSLKKHGVKMYLVSGTDHQYVLQEALALRVDHYFNGNIYGAFDNTEAFTKEKIIQRILNENNLQGNELMVAGDGPVEIRNAKSRNALAIGVASDEVKRQGLNPRKRKRLIEAGADIIIPDFTKNNELIKFLFNV
jgi:phosphoglycolate phosphatase-like HAD superfamily hydrolase